MGCGRSQIEGVPGSKCLRFPEDGGWIKVRGDDQTRGRFPVATGGGSRKMKSVACEFFFFSVSV